MDFEIVDLILFQVSGIGAIESDLGMVLCGE